MSEKLFLDERLDGAGVGFVWWNTSNNKDSRRIVYRIDDEVAELFPGNWGNVTADEFRNAGEFLVKGNLAKSFKISLN